MSSTDSGVLVEEAQVPARTIDPSLGTLRRVLLVDDDPALLDALSSAIEFHLRPMLVHVCDTASRGLDRVKGTRYDAMIIDVNMPNMSGLELLSAVKRVQPSTPVLLISASADDSLKAKAFEAGASDFIPKPFDRHEFLCAMKRSLKRSPVEDRIDSPS